VEDASGTVITEGPRIFTVPLIDPNTISNGMNQMKFVGFAKFFLEDQTLVYPSTPKNVRPWTVRLMHYGYGQAGPVTGPLIKRLRLVE
jgi:hypothetical protein